MTYLPVSLKRSRMNLFFRVNIPDEGSFSSFRRTKDYAIFKKLGPIASRLSQLLNPKKEAMEGNEEIKDLT